MSYCNAVGFRCCRIVRRQKAVAERFSEVEAVSLQHCAIRLEDSTVLLSYFWFPSEDCPPGTDPEQYHRKRRDLLHHGGGRMIAMKPKVSGRLNFVLNWPRSRGNQTYIGGCPST
jgi:calcineurin-like phosphoesterase family protein